VARRRREVETEPSAIEAAAVTFVTDTHPLLFFAGGNLRRLSREAHRIFRRAQEGRDRVHVPAICFFELALLLEGGRIRSPLPFEDWHALLAAQTGFAVEPLVFEDIREARALDALVDPFDRLIAGVAVRLDYPLITNDERILESGLVRVIW
jgi:PIN domain nuclease of toxin-antitoxin system